MMSPEELKNKIEQKEELLLLDIREQHEVDICQIEGSMHIPMMDIPNNLTDLPRDINIVVYCHLGVRSVSVIQYLLAQGFTNLINLDGGIENWAVCVDSEMTRY
jgi:rhodanese-related sulfurtransferase